MTREDIEKMCVTKPHCFETNREEGWYKFGLTQGLEIADMNPKLQWISVKDKLPPIQPDSLWSKKVICAPKYGYDIYINRYGGRYRGSDIGWSGNNVAYWMPLPELPKE